MNFINISFVCGKYRNKKLILQLFDKIFYEIMILFVLYFCFVDNL